MFQKVLLAGGGGFLGTTARYLLGGLIQRWLPDTFPYATFVINVTGCLVIGFLGVLAQERLSLGADGRVFWMTGVLGGYTTFSTFGYETTLLLRAGSTVGAAVNVIGQVVLGVLAVWLGAAAARSLG
jgi:fluoride exporter